MALTTCTVLLALTMNGVPAAENPRPEPAPARAATVADAAQPQTIQAAIERAPLERWQVDTPRTRPAALPVMYAAFGALQAADIYSTRRALGANAYEANPIMRNASHNAGAMLAVKALSTAGTIYFTERAWKKNRKGALVLMAVINGVSAAITARNLRNARR